MSDRIGTSSSVVPAGRRGPLNIDAKCERMAVIPSGLLGITGHVECGAEQMHSQTERGPPSPVRDDAGAVLRPDRVAPAAPGRAGTDSIEDTRGRPLELVPAVGGPVDDALGAYFGEIGKLSLLTAEGGGGVAQAGERGRQIVGEPERAVFSL